MTTILFASLPTPNGPLHIGHAYAFLPMDAAARHARRRGERVFFCGGIDHFESHVELVARREDRDPDELAAHFGRRIAGDLDDLDLGFDVFIDPGDAVWRRRYEASVHSVVRALAATGSVKPVLRPWPYDTATGAPLPPSLIEGECPACGTVAGGTICEACGAVFDPSELQRPRARMRGLDVVWRPSLRTELNLGANTAAAQRLSEGLAAWIADPVGRPRAKRALARRGPCSMLTIPGRRGVPFADGTIAFSYAMYTAFVDVALAELINTGALQGDPWADPSVRMGRTGGPDLLAPSVLATQAQLVLRPDRRPLDFLATHGFLTLDGEKVSTSRKHALWVRDLVRDLRVPADALRLFLARHAPRRGDGDFRVAEFAHFHDEVFQGRLVAAAPVEVERPLTLEDTASLGRDFTRAVTQLDRCLRPDDPDLPGLVRVVEGWLDQRPRFEVPEQKRAWRAALAWLVAPVCPSLARVLGLHRDLVGDVPGRAARARDPRRESLDARVLSSWIGASGG